MNAFEPSAATSESGSDEDIRRGIPPLDRLLADPAVVALVPLYGREQVKVQARQAIAALRARLVSEPAEPAPRELLAREVAELPRQVAAGLAAALGGKLARVLNATGVFLHTNLGRAPLPRAVAAALPPLLDAYCDLELDLGTGRRGQRNRRAESLLTAATGAESALVVNNNAAALLLSLAALAKDREVVVSRGELVEIGGSFRIPDILRAAGARLVEVGTTNRTRIGDYAAAVGPATALLLKVFPSNFRLSGFVAAVAPAELAGLGRQAGVPVLVDEGSGLLRRSPAPQLAAHPSLAELVAIGCDLACGSGDKLLGGPQAGLLVGRDALLARCRRHPLYRVLRPDRGTFAALEGVLRLHLAGAPLPLDRLWPDPELQRARLERAAAALGAEIVVADAFLGGGSAPEAPIPGEALALPGSDRLLARLRAGRPPVVGYLRHGRLVLDLRTVDPDDDETLLAAVRAALDEPVEPVEMSAD
ncbi:MAG TPA: L-seryl-tRNA(Sec) selenium transferase [Thermoanaerobaculia bacterium]|nr:L-seryl-tRNA(Sec) selenium transferase [Thermoanaerobaculia bacterium]